MTGATTDLPTTLADRYHLERELGTGGMATVYLAEDVKHRRKVAVKVLKPELAAIIGGERFLQEIEVTANLQHPNILPLYDSGAADQFLYYVMPYIEGESLREKLNREKQLSLEETIEITKSIAAALQYAHERDIIHRDIKPENILLQAGQALVADFGIALAVSHAGGSRMTETGLSLGTPHYMSPEQATGEREIDARSDIYSLAALVYEMLVGDPPHSGSTVQAIIAKILSEEPTPVTRTRSLVPTYVDAALRKALAKSPADRFADAAAFVTALTNPNFTLPMGIPAATRSISGLPRIPWMPLAGAGVVVAAVALWFGARTPTEVTAHPLVKFSVMLPDGQGLMSTEAGPAFALSPDGARVVYVGPRGGGVQLWERSFDRLDASPLRSTEESCCPTYSPDGSSIAFLTSSLELKVLDLSGSLDRTVADSGLIEHELYGGSLDWGDDGYLYVATTNGLARVSATGGELELVTQLDPSRRDRVHAWADVLPDGNGALVTVIPQAIGDQTEYMVGVADFDTGDVRVFAQGVYARYLNTGHILYVREDGVTLVTAFDADRLETIGPAQEVLAGVRVKVGGAADLAVSQAGTLLYGTGDFSSRELYWVDRNGTSFALQLGEPGVINDVALSRDGDWIAASLVRTDGPEDIWLKRVSGGAFSRFTFQGALNWHQTFSPDGNSLTFVSDRDGVSRLYSKPINGSEATLLITDEPRAVFEGIWSPDGDWLIYRTDSEASGSGDILAVQPAVAGSMREIVATPASEVTPAISADGRWLAYSSDESGRREIYVQPFPEATSLRWQVSSTGGTEPIWARNGSELFYRDAAGAIVTVTYAGNSTFTYGTPQVLLSASQYRSNAFHGAYDVSRDDQRFLMVKLETIGEGELIWVQNWFDELRRTTNR